MSRSPHGGEGPQTAERPASAQADRTPQQFVNFAFYKLDRAYLRLDDQTQRAGATELLNVLGEKPDELILNCYSTVGIRGDVDFTLWRISERLDDIRSLETAIRRSGLGRHLDTPYSYLSLTKRSVYLDKIDPEHDELRRRVVPGRFRYNFVYPFVKTREWYMMSKQTRQGVMDEHIEVGTKYQSVKLNTTYSFGVDDQEFMLAFETDKPGDFLDLVMELRHTEGSKYTERDTPIFTCVRCEPADMVAAMGVPVG